MRSNNMDNKALYKLSYGLFVLTATDGQKDNGCIVNTAIQAASSPNTMSICLNKDNFTHDMIVKTKSFNVSVLSVNATFDLFKHFGFQSGRDVNKFADFNDFERADNGVPYITRGTNACFSVRVDKCIDLGSHSMFLLHMSITRTISSQRHRLLLKLLMVRLCGDVKSAVMNMLVKSFQMTLSVQSASIRPLILKRLQFH